MNKEISREDLAPFIVKDRMDYVVKALLLQQKSTWHTLKVNYDELKETQIKIFEFNGFIIKAQFNKKRIASASAKVDRASISKRACFLCKNNLPSLQKGINFDDKYLILANPFPIFDEHFTIASVTHQPQRIFKRFTDLLLLTKELGESYTLFYNGPASGASAPDHLHFQAGNLGFLPLDSEKDNLIGKNILPLIEKDNLNIFYSKNYFRNFILLESDNSNILNKLFQKIFEIFNLLMPHPDEPMLNIITYYQHNRWQVIIFPREKHRPDFYFFDEPEKILFSPASVDLGGMCVLPRENDFQKITKDLLIKAFKQVSIEEVKYFRLLENIKKLNLNF